jgi:hypothetical protein
MPARAGLMTRLVGTAAATVLATVLTLLCLG